MVGMCRQSLTAGWLLARCILLFRFHSFPLFQAKKPFFLADLKLLLTGLALPVVINRHSGCNTGIVGVVQS